MAEFLLKYADGKGEIRQQVAEAGSEKELRERMTQQGFLVYRLADEQINPRLDPSQFVFHPPAGVDIVEEPDSP